MNIKKFIFDKEIISFVSLLSFIVCIITVIPSIKIIENYSFITGFLSFIAFMTALICYFYSKADNKYKNIYKEKITLLKKDFSETAEYLNTKSRTCSDLLCKSNQEVLISINKSYSRYFNNFSINYNKFSGETILEQVKKQAYERDKLNAFREMSNDIIHKRVPKDDLKYYFEKKSEKTGVLVEDLKNYYKKVIRDEEQLLPDITNYNNYIKEELELAYNEAIDLCEQIIKKYPHFNFLYVMKNFINEQYIALSKVIYTNIIENKKTLVVVSDDFAPQIIEWRRQTAACLAVKINKKSTNEMREIEKIFKVNNIYEFLNETGVSKKVYFDFRSNI